MLIATRNCVYSMDDRGQQPPQTRLTQAGLRCVAEGITCYAVAIDNALALWTQGRLIEVATGIHEPVESLLILREDPIVLLIGTEGAHMHRLTLGRGVERVTSFDELPVRPNWSTPWGGPPAIRSMAKSTDGFVYAAIHVGGVMLSGDGGLSWEPCGPGIDDDVHQVATTPADPARVYANTRRGVYVSPDRGMTWAYRSQGADRQYGRALAVSVGDGELILASTSDGPDEEGKDVRAQLLRSTDGGASWHAAGGAFPSSSPRNIDTHQLAITVDGVAWAACGQELFVGPRDGQEWLSAWRAPEPIRMISCAREVWHEGSGDFLSRRNTSDSLAGNP